MVWPHAGGRSAAVPHYVVVRDRAVSQDVSYAVGFECAARYLKRAMTEVESRASPKPARRAIGLRNAPPEAIGRPLDRVLHYSLSPKMSAAGTLVIGAAQAGARIIPPSSRTMLSASPSPPSSIPSW